MLTNVATVLAGLVGVGTIFVGARAFWAPQAAVGFGIPDTPTEDRSFHAWLTVKAVRDIACGLFIFVLLADATPHLLGWFMLTITGIPIGEGVGRVQQGLLNSQAVVLVEQVRDGASACGQVGEQASPGGGRLPVGDPQGLGRSRDDVLDVEQLSTASGEPQDVVSDLLDGKEPPAVDVTNRIIRRVNHLRETRLRPDGTQALLRRDCIFLRPLPGSSVKHR